MDMLFIQKLLGRSKWKSLTRQKNEMEWYCIFNLLWNLSVNNITWSNIEIPSPYIEKCLVENGSGAFFEENGELKFGSAYATENIYNVPTKWQIHYNGKIYSKSILDSVFVRCDLNNNPFIMYVLQYADKICDIERTINTNVATHKMPFIIKSNDKKLLTHKNNINQIQNNEIAIFIDETLNINDFQFFKTDQEYIIDKLDIHKKFVYAEFKELLGFNNVQIEKKERLITDEAEQNNEIIVNGYVKSMLDERKECCKKIKELFNIDINVKLNREEIKKDDNSIQGKLHDNAKNSYERMDT